MGLLHWFVKAAEELKAAWRDSSHYCSAVFGFAAARYQFTLFQAVEQTSDIRISGDHPARDLSTKKSLRCTAQDAKHIVLRRREIFGLENSNQPTRQHIACAHQIQKHCLFGGTQAPYVIA